MKNIIRETVGLLLLVSCNVITGSLSSHSLEQLSDDAGESLSAQSSDPRICKSSGQFCQSHMHGLQERTYGLSISNSATPSSPPAQPKNRLSSAIIPTGGRGTRHPSRTKNLGAVDYRGSKRPRTSGLPMKDLAMDNNPTSSSGVEQLLSSRKRERPRQAVEIHSHPAAAADILANTSTPPVDACVDQEAINRPRKMVKLMGVFVGTDVDPNSIAPQRSILHHSHSSPHDTSSPALLNHRAGTSDKAKHVNLTGKRNPIIIKSSNPQEISQVSTCGAASMVNQNHVPSRYVQNAKSIGAENLRFSKDVFELSGSPYSNWRAEKIFADKLQHMLSDGLRPNELAMTEEKFVKHHLDFFRRCKRDGFIPKAYEIMTSFKHLMENQNIWLEHWGRQSNIDLQSEMNNMEHTVREILILFLFYVEMISTIVPFPTSSTQQPDQVHKSMDAGTTGLQIAQAWDFLKNSFSTQKPAQNNQGYNLTPKLERNIIGIMKNLEENYKISGFVLTQLAVWIMIKVWIRNYRKSLEALLTKIEYPYNNHPYNSVAVFLNLVFCHSIHNLTLKLVG